MPNSIPSKNIIILLLALVIVLTGYLVYNLFFAPKATPLIYQAPGIPPVLQPESPTAAKYYPGGGNAIDFRDGATEDFSVSIEKKADRVTINWPQGIKVTQVQVYNLGTLSDLQDHYLVWDLGNWDITKPLTTAEIGSEQAKIPESEIPEPETYLTSPHEIGGVPEGFYNNTFYGEETPEDYVIFKKGDRYSIEVSGVKEGKFLMGAYTLNF